MTDEWFRVNVDEHDLEVIHHDPPTPRCDIKHMLDDISIDRPTVDRLISEGKARWCQHCKAG